MEDSMMQPLPRPLHERNASSDANAGRSMTTRGTKRTAAVDQKENVPLTGVAKPAKSLDGASSKLQPVGGNKFGFRATPLPSVEAVQPQQKRRRTNEHDNAAAAAGNNNNEPFMEDTTARQAHASAGALEPLLLGPCDSISGLWRTTMMDETTEAECRAAMAGKISASKFDYKEKIGQLEAQMKSLRKVVGILMKKGESFLGDAKHIEIALNEAVLREKQSARDLGAQRAHLQDKVTTCLQLLKQTQNQRDKLQVEIKSNAAMMAASQGVLDAKDAEKNAIQEKLDQTSQILTDTMATLETTTIEREEAQRMVAEMQGQLDEASTMLAALEEEKAALIATCESQENKLDEQQTLAADTDRDFAAVRAQYVTLMEEWGQLQKAHDKTQQVAEDLQHKLTATTQELAASIQAHEATKSELAAAHHSAAEAKLGHAHEMSSQKVALNREYDSLKNSMEQAIAKNQDEMATLSASFDQLTQSKSLLADAYAKSNQDLAALRSSLMVASDKVASTDIEVRKVEGELMLVKLQLEKKNEECFVTVNSFAQIQKFHEERQVILQGEKEALDKAKHELSLKCNVLESTSKMTQATLDATSTNLTETTLQLETLKVEHEKLVAQSASDRASWESQSTEFKNQVTTLSTELATKVASFEATITELQTKLASETARANNLARELTSFKALSGVSNESQMENLVKLSMEAEMLRSQVADKGQLSMTLTETTRKLEDALRRMAESEHTRRQLHNTIQELKGNIRVFTRVRPMFNAGAKTVDSQGDANMLTGDDAIQAIEVSQDGRKLRLDNGNGTKTNYGFDAVWGPNTTQKEVFDEISQLVQSALDGYHVCLFSYGQTGSGKTWSMTGSVTGEQRGIIPRSVEKVLEQAQSLSTGGWTYSLSSSYLEIYNESIRDLLCKDSAVTDLDVKRDTAGRTNIPGLTRCAINTINDVTLLMAKAAKNRSTASTNMNERSSRSHSVFTLYLEASNPLSKQQLSGSLNLCDLAGSERLAKSGAGADAARLKETQSINKSLSSLSDVFLALSQKSSHVPFRNSKLTYLLQPCLSGDGKTAMIVNLNPSLSSANESSCTLRFAAQVNQVELGKPKKSAKSGVSDDAIEALSVAAASASASHRPSLTGSSSTSSIRPATASASGIKKPSIGSTTARPTTSTAMRR